MKTLPFLLAACCPLAWKLVPKMFDALRARVAASSR